MGQASNAIGYRSTVIALAISAGLLGGCDWVEKVYTFRQKEDPVGTFTVRVKIGPDRKLAMLEDFAPDGHEKSRTIRDYFAECQYFDDDNWACDGYPGEERVVMSKGILTHYYWKQVRDYKPSYRLSFMN
jgi:hypothetical protein